MRILFCRVILVFFAALSASCGFQLRGSYDLPYESVYVSGQDHLYIIAGLKHAIRASNAKLSDSAEKAQATFMRTREIRRPTILSLSSAGRVREKRLNFQYSYRVVDAKGRNLVSPGIIEIYRDLTYGDSEATAKAQEEEQLWLDMERDIVDQLMRRLSAVKPTTTPQEILN